MVTLYRRQIRQAKSTSLPRRADRGPKKEKQRKRRDNLYLFDDAEGVRFNGGKRVPASFPYPAVSAFTREKTVERNLYLGAGDHTLLPRMSAFFTESQHSRENRNIPEGIATFPRESQHSRGNRNIPEGIATFPRESQHS